ncbi:MAG: AcrB/AcrD/AcrF family protein, partial [Bryobacterales bacterium]|nr:AcrB/AcrD/AcrF family protein [Bryobacterales bacterium]
AIKHSLADGQLRIVAPWLGPTKLAGAIMYATITNIVAYLPFLLIQGTTGEFIYSLPVVITCALVASRIVSMTFIPLLGYYILRPEKKRPKTIEQLRTRGFTGRYAALAKLAIHHRWAVAIGSLAFLVVGGVLFASLKTSFFPDDVQYWSYIDVWLPNAVNFQTTSEAAKKVEEIVRQQAHEYGRHHSE